MGNINKCSLLTDCLDELWYTCTVEFYADSSWNDDFYMTDLEKFSRVKTQGTEQSIWYTTFCVQGEEEKERVRWNLHMCVGKCMNYCWKNCHETGFSVCLQRGELGN